MSSFRVGSLSAKARKSCQPSADSITAEFQTSPGINISRNVLRAWWRGFPWFPWPSSCMQAFRYQAQCQASDGGVWSRPLLDSGAVETCSVEWRRMRLHLDGWVWVWWVPGEHASLHCVNCKVWRRDNGKVSAVGFGPLVPQKGDVNASAYQDRNIQCFQLCENCLRKALFWSSMTVPQCTKQGP